MQLALFLNFLELPLGETQCRPSTYEQVAIHFPQEVHRVRTPIIYKPRFLAFIETDC